MPTCVKFTPSVDRKIRKPVSLVDPSAHVSLTAVEVVLAARLVGAASEVEEFLGADEVTLTFLLWLSTCVTEGTLVVWRVDFSWDFPSIVVIEGEESPPNEDKLRRDSRFSTERVRRRAAMDVTPFNKVISKLAKRSNTEWDESNQIEP